MLEQGYLTKGEYEESVAQSLPAPKDIQLPHQTFVEGIDVGYFASWVTQQVIERYGATRAFDGGLQVRTTLDLDMQRAAEQRGRRLPARPRRPDGGARGDRKLDGRGARDGGRAQLQRNALQPRHPGRAPAGLVLQGVRSGRGARRRHLARLGVDLQAEDLLRARPSWDRKVRSPQRRRLVHRLELADRRHGLLGQLDLRRSRPEGGYHPHRRSGAPHGHHHADLHQPGDDDRRTEGRRDAAGHGPRL